MRTHLSARSVTASMLSLLILAGTSYARPDGGEDKPKPIAPFAMIDGKREPVPDIEMGDLETIKRIIDEGRNRNQVMDHLKHLCEEIGPRLTGSSNAEKANRWALDQFKGWGLQNGHLDEWGTIGARFDRGPSTVKILAQTQTSDVDKEGNKTSKVGYDPLRDCQFTTLAWVRGTEGAKRGLLLRMPDNDEELAAIKDKVEGSWILIPARADSRKGTRGIGNSMRDRYDRWAKLRTKIENPAAEEPKQETPAAPVDDGVTGQYAGRLTGPGLPADGAETSLRLRKRNSGALMGFLSVKSLHNGAITDATLDQDTGTLRFTWTSPKGETSFQSTLKDHAIKGYGNLKDDQYTLTLVREEVAPPDPEPVGPSMDEKILALNPAGFVTSARDERVWTTSANRWRELDVNSLPKDIEVSIRESDYDYANSRLFDGVTLALEVNLDHTLIPGPIPVYNTIAEIPGTELPNEIVIVSAHLDSWNGPGSQGTTDNGTGSSVTIEAARILMAAKAQPKRTIRFILWTGEEQGLLGSKSYVDRIKDEWPNISACFVDDGGTNYEGGIPAADSMIPMLAAATAWSNTAFADVPDGKGGTGLFVNIRPVGPKLRGGGGSDHVSFNNVGIPGFFWDEIGRADYQFGWHTQNDRLDLAVPEYLAQSATNAAIVAYNLACAPTLLPRGEQDAPASEGERPAGGALKAPPEPAKVPAGTKGS
jgi:hypothetical protein